MVKVDLANPRQIILEEFAKGTLAKKLQLQLQYTPHSSRAPQLTTERSEFRFTSHHEASNIHIELEVSNGQILGGVGNEAIKFGAPPYCRRG